MQFTMRSAALILSFAAASLAHGHGHVHDHAALHRRQDFVQEGPDGHVWVTAEATQWVTQVHTVAGGAPPASSSSVVAANPAPNGGGKEEGAPTTHTTAEAAHTTAAAVHTSAAQAPANGQNTDSSPRTGGAKEVDTTRAADPHTTLVSQARSTLTTASAAISSAFAGGNSGDLTISVVNKMGTPVSVYYGANAGAPAAGQNAAGGMVATTTHATFPTGWAGRIYVGENNNVNNSLIEASYTSPASYGINIDISYVDGFSVPIVCTCQGASTPIAGCNKDLMKLSTCPATDLIDGVCGNPMNTVTGNGPPTSFFAPCEGAAYTYPNDNAADHYCTTGKTITCCVGSSCPAASGQK